jgi:hypothetical protein
VPEHCLPVHAGAVDLVVESRQLTDQVLIDTYGPGEIPEAEVHFDDFGASLHVCGAHDGLEYLRFDCFELEPHYHYIEQHAQANVIVRIDEIAVGDPIAFSLRCIEEHLPDTRNAGGRRSPPMLKAATRSMAVARVRELMLQAQAAHRADRSPEPSLTVARSTTIEGAAPCGVQAQDAGTTRDGGLTHG